MGFPERSLFLFHVFFSFEAIGITLPFPLLKSQKSMHGHFINTSNFPDIILLDGEQITAELDKVLYVSPVNNVAEGKLYISNFKLCFVGLYLQGPFDFSMENLVEQDDSQKKKRKVTVEINFGSIFEITKTPFMSVKGPTSSMWVPEGVSIYAADFQIATVFYSSSCYCFISFNYCHLLVLH